MQPFLRRHWFALTLAGGLIAFEILIMLVLAFGQPNGRQWLGGTLISPADSAVSLAEIREGSLFIKDPFAVEPHAGRIDLVWSALGLIHRATGVNSLALQELARWIFTIFLAFALVAAARSVADNEDAAQKGTLLMIGGVGLGWVWALTLAALHRWIPGAANTPDLLQTMAVAPAVLGTPQIILSFALLVTSIHGIWKSVHDRTRATWTVVAAAVALTFIHPLFIPLLLVVTVMAWTKKLGRRPAHERTHQPALVFLLCLLPAIAYNLWFILNDGVYSDVHLLQNVVTLPGWGAWFLALAPSAVAIGWLLFRHDREQRFLAVSRWCLAWLIAATTLFALPTSWRAVFMEALMVPLVLLGLPSWIAWLKRVPKNGVPVILAIIVSITPLCLLLSQLAWMRNAQALYSQPASVFRAWDALSHKSHAVVIADDLNVSIWTPAWSGATAWIGPANATPSNALKQSDWKDLFNTNNVTLARRIVTHAGATDLLFTDRDRAARIASLLGSGWTTIFQEGNVILLEKR